VRRSIVGMFVAVTGLSTALGAQGPGSTGGGAGAWSLGIAATLGGGWQIEGLDIGLSQGVHAGPVRRLGIGGRLGSFIDEGAIIGGTQGFVGALALSARGAPVRIADVGAENNPTTLGLDFTLEVAGYLGSHSPLAQGGKWVSVAFLPGLRFGGGEGSGGRFSILLGPTVFLGHSTDVHGFLGVRYEMPLARAEPHP
jgi:hypothetical protein